MRRLILEFSLKELKKVIKDIDLSRVEKIDTMEILQTLRHDQEEISVIGRIRVGTSRDDIADYVRLVAGNIATVQVLDKEKDGSYIIFIKRARANRPFTTDILKAGGYATWREIKDGKMKLTLLGSEKQLKTAIEELKQTKIHYKVVSLTDARFASDSPLNALTEKQRRVLTTAFELGYYDLPRRIDSEQLAEKLNLKRATLVVHRRKAEKRVLSKIFA